MTILTAILPCNDLDASEAFYNRLGFRRPPESAYDEYRMLSDGKGGDIHLQPAVEGWLVPGQNPFGLYLYTEEVDALAAIFRDEIIEREKRPTHKPWGMYEFALSDPDQTLVRIGWPSRLIK
jgi:catechol 2,3-dioxygenase-like lactoylglutathione lyase family enzyme